MESAGVRKLARALRVMVVVVFACNLIALLFVPFFVMLQSAKISLASVGSDAYIENQARTVYGYMMPDEIRLVISNPETLYGEEGVPSR